MPRPSKVVLDHSLRELVVSRFFDATSPRFDVAMGSRLAKARKSMGLTQRELADRFGLSQVHISRLEKGKNLVAMPKCAAFKSVLGIHFEHVLIEDGFYREEEISTRFDKQIRRTVGSKRNSYNV